ncbi:MAG: T9SS type A sorting domain-containing protein [Ignavibacteriaceae bacterium]
MNKIIQRLDKNLVITFILFITYTSFGQGLIINHNCTNINSIPYEWINTAKENLHIAYQHTSHGSQLISGMTGLQNWKGDQYAFNNGGSNEALDLHDYAIPGASDLGSPDRTSWAQATSDFLKDPNNSYVNVIIWSWCGQVSSADSSDIQTYLDLMSSLENNYPNVKFVYMTGHLDGSGADGKLNQRNEEIRRYCGNNNKILYDFADIESYDPDGNFYLNKMANDNCDYDSDNNGTRDKNWAVDWQESHTENVDWYNCSPAHSQALNGNRKAYAAWWLWASLAGWEGAIASKAYDRNVLEKSFSLSQNYPNPFNPSTNFNFRIPEYGFVSLKVYDILGNEIVTLVNGNKQPGEYKIKFNADNYSLTSGVYIYQLTTGKLISTKKFSLIK